MVKHDSDSSVEIAETAERYYRAMVTGDRDALRELFDARASIIGRYEGELLWQDLDSFIEETESLVGQHGREECRVECIRVDGDIATICIGGRYAGLWFIDHLAMIESNHRWVIISKSFNVAS
ncbi:nuclear transport factor 2 family protein [Marimonas lutisalis]|uniref:nuclear transport factor 2 family protein n=1 Tax=Marimonas lutisalis TaxID=2545756 RepID=UPI0010F76A30|nr:nuclear transport factor 2 family protein [Marimonas lutisalis]